MLCGEIVFNVLEFLVHPREGTNSPTSKVCILWYNLTKQILSMKTDVEFEKYEVFLNFGTCSDCLHFHGEPKLHKWSYFVQNHKLQVEKIVIQPDPYSNRFVSKSLVERILNTFPRLKSIHAVSMWIENKEIECYHDLELLEIGEMKSESEKSGEEFSIYWPGAFSRIRL